MLSMNCVRTTVTVLVSLTVTPVSMFRFFINWQSRTSTSTPIPTNTPVQPVKRISLSAIVTFIRPLFAMSSGVSGPLKKKTSFDMYGEITRDTN